MNRTLGRIVRYAAPTGACLLVANFAFAQAQEQHWQATPNYPSNYGPNYQPPTQDNASQPGQPTGQNSNPQTQPAAGQPYPTIERRDGGQQGQPQSGQPQYGPSQYGPPAAADNRQNYPQYPRDPAAQGQQGPIQGPPIQGAPPPSGPPKAPFVLTLPEANALENLLTDWEKRNREIHVMESKFFRWRYDAVFGAPGAGQPPPPPDEGELKFAAPDKGWFKTESKDPKHPELSEQWLCDGKSVFQWDYKEKIVHEWIMPPEMQGKGIGDGPLPFVFGIEAEKLKQRYFMRILATPPNVQNEVWLEAFPKYQADAANYSKVEVILQIVGPTHALFPYAIQIYAPNGKDRIVYQLQNPTINPSGGLLRMFAPDWTRPDVGFGWTKHIELPRTASPQARMRPGTMQR